VERWLLAVLLALEVVENLEERGLWNSKKKKRRKRERRMREWGLGSDLRLGLDIGRLMLVF
jgi:hypothetical protein